MIFAIVKYALPVFFSLIVLEYVIYRKDGRLFPLREAGVSLLMAVIYQVLNKQNQSLLMPLHTWVFEHRLFPIPTDSWWAWIVGFFGVEFAYYWLHRFGHEVRWMWASHGVHHSPTTMTFSGAYRLGITSLLSGLFVFFLPLILIGFPPKMVFSLFAINLIYQFFLHTELFPKWGWLELYLNTPSHHRVHHAINEAYIDKNYGGVLIIFDRLFGTLAIEDDKQPITYGLLGKAPTLNPLKLFFQEWVGIAQDVVQARSFGEALNFAFGRPGWKPEVSTLDKSPRLVEAEGLHRATSEPATLELSEKVYATDTHYRR